MARSASMIKLLVVCLCMYGAYGSASSPRQSYELFDDVDNEAEIIESAEPLKGSNNLHEKSVPVIRLSIPSGYPGYLGLYATKNLAERAQVPYNLPPSHLSATTNLHEKPIPLQAPRYNANPSL